MRRLGPYKLGARLGSGSLGEVFLATSAGGEVAVVKKFDRDLARDLSFVRDLTTELAAARAFNGVGVARVLEEGRQGDQLWSANQPIGGETLGALVKRARFENLPLPPALLAWLASQVTGALRRLHVADRSDGRRGFVLGRFSPRDVMVSYEGRVFITGFGEHRARLRVPVSSRRTPYCSPEVLGGREPSVASDVFSVCAVLYEVFGGQSAFRRSDDEATTVAVRRGDAAPLRSAKTGLSPEVSELIMQGILPKPEARPQTLDELHDLLVADAGSDVAEHVDELAAVTSELFKEQLDGWRRMTAALVPERTRATVDLQQDPDPAEASKSELETARDPEPTLDLSALRAAASGLFSNLDVDSTGERDAPEGPELPADGEAGVDPSTDVQGRSRVSTDDLLGGQSTEASQTGDTELPRGAAGANGATRPRLSRVARYRLTRRIEIDGPRQRYLGVDPNLGREVEIEVLDPTVLDSRVDPSDWIRAIKLEGRYVAQLQMDGLPRLLDAGRGGDLYFLVYERRPGRSLMRHLAEGRPLNPARVIADLAEALDRVHRLGFVLGDVRPAVVRVLVDGRSELSRVRRLTPAERAPHPHWALGGGIEPPELIRRADYSAASDQFGLGVLLYQLLLGVPPYRAHDGESLRSSILGDRVVPPHVADPEVPEALSLVCLRMLAPDPAARFASMADVVAALRSFTATTVRSAPSFPTDDALETALAFAHLCRRVAGVSTLSATEDSPWNPDPAVWAADISRRLGLGGGLVQATLIAAAARDLARRTHLPVLGPELESVVPHLARSLLVPPPADESYEQRVARDVLDLVEQFADLVSSGEASPSAAVRMLRTSFSAELLDALVANFDDRLPGAGGDGPRVLVAGEFADDAFVAALEQAGLTVVPVTDGHQAWEVLRASRVDGAVFGARLAGRDGLSLSRLCRARDELRELPLWLLGASIQPGDRRVAESLDVVVVEGADRARLLDLVVLRLKGSTEPLVRRSSSADALAT